MSAALAAPSLEDKEFTKAEFKERYHDVIRGNMLALLEGYITDLMTTEDPEVRRKGLAYFSQVVGVEAEKKVDPMANLPVFNITINGGGVQLTATKEAEIVEMKAVQEASDKRVIEAEIRKPSLTMQQMVHVNHEALDVPLDESSADDQREQWDA
jgi:hypothetical protein